MTEQLKVRLGSVLLGEELVKKYKDRSDEMVTVAQAIELTKGLMSIGGNVPLVSEIGLALVRIVEARTDFDLTQIAVALLENNCNKVLALISEFDLSVTLRTVFARLVISPTKNELLFILQPLLRYWDTTEEDLLKELVDALQADKKALSLIAEVKSSMASQVDNVVLKWGQLKYKIVRDPQTGDVSIEAIPYPFPQAGQCWQDAKGQEYLIVADEQRAVKLSEGILVDLVDGAPKDMKRGIGFFQKGEK